MKAHWLLAICVLGLAAGAGGQRKSESALQKDLRNLQSRKAALMREMRKTRRVTNAVVADIRGVDNRLAEVEKQIEATTERLSESRREQRDLGSRLQEATVEVAETKEQVRQRLRRMYMRGDASAISALVGTRSFGDVATRKQLLERVAKKDRSVLTKYQSLRNEVATKKARQDALVGRISGLVREQRGNQDRLESVRDEKGELLQDLRSKQVQLRRILAQFEADEQSIAAQIAAFSRRPGSPTKFTGRFQRPVSAPITSGFGNRFHPILRRPRLHAGIDFGARSGTPIRASASGVVISARYMGGYGNVVILDHGGGFTTVYAHCSRIYVSAGQRVSSGQTIAAVGSTGMSTGPHLHFEIRVRGRAVNPRSYL